MKPLFKLFLYAFQREITLFDPKETICGIYLQSIPSIFYVQNFAIRRLKITPAIGSEKTVIMQAYLQFLGRYPTNSKAPKAYTEQ